MSSFADTRFSPGRKSLLALTVIVAVACAGLGGWQLSRLVDRRAVNRLALSHRNLPAVDLTREPLPSPFNYRRVTLTGIYDFDQELVIRGRLLLGTPGIQVVTPLRMPGRDSVVLVNRGFVPTPDAGRPAATGRFREALTARVEGVALTIPDAGDGRPLQTSAGETWARLDLTALRARLPYPLAPYYVIAEADTQSTTDHTAKGSVLPVRIPPPPLDDGPHLSYAVQWFLIGAAALGFGIVFVRRGGPLPSAPS
jgi:surfeit locus 1 family protein